MFDLELSGEIGYWGISARDVKYDLSKLSGDIKVLFNSNGGSVIEGVAIFNEFREYRKNKGNVEITIQGIGASMGSYIPLAASKVIVYDNTTYMIHNARIWTGGDQNHLRKTADTIEGFSNILKAEYIKKTGKTDKDIKSKMDEETYFFGKEILEQGFADEVIESGDDIDKESALLVAKASFDETMKNTEARLKDENIESIAAVLEDCRKINGVNPNQQALAEKITNQNKEVNMEFTKAKFDEQANLHAEALKQSISDSTDIERKRVAAIFALGGNAEFTQKAIQDGLSEGDSAVALLKEQKENLAKAKIDFEQAAEDVNGLGQDDISDDTSTETLAQKEADEALANWGEK